MCVCVCVCVCYHENNVRSWLSKQWLCGNSCTWAYDVRLHVAGTNETKSAQQAKQGDVLLSKKETKQAKYINVAVLKQVMSKRKETSN